MTQVKGAKEQGLRSGHPFHEISRLFGIEAAMMEAPAGCPEAEHKEIGKSNKMAPYIRPGGRPAQHSAEEVP